MEKKSDKAGSANKSPENLNGHYYPKKRTMGQIAADNLTTWAGSWKFIISLIVILIIWIFLNITQLFFQSFDPYPFILMNLFLSCLAAFQAPVILMSQNREVERDRARAERDFAVNRKAERENRDMQRDINYIKKQLSEINKKL
jgi:uncharacterized membrane protein